MSPARLLSRLRRDERGNIAILSALTLPILVGSFGWGTEAGYWYLEKRTLQLAADVAAHAGGVALRGGASQAALEATSLDIAGRSGFDPALGTHTLVSPPATGAYAGVAEAVEVSLERQQPRYFTKIYSQEPVEIAARAVALITGGARACLLALSPTGSGAVTVSGSTTVTFTDCDIASNSNASDSFLMSGGSAVVTTGCVHTVGGAEATGNLTLTDCARPHEQAPVSRDPYADIPEPELFGTCQSGNIGSNNRTTAVSAAENHPSGVLSMRFCGGLDLRGTVEFAPGLYIVDGGDFRINSTTVLRGTGVTFFLTNGAEANLNGSATVDLTAPTSGPFAGIMIFGDRDDAAVTHVINGNSASRLDGAVYTPAASISYSGNFGGSGGCTQLVVDNITFTGNSELSVDCQALGTRDLRVDEAVVLVE